MLLLTEKRLSKCFYSLCLLCAVSMTLWVTLEYMKNEDVIEISYRKFDQTKGDSHYPAMSLCFVDAYRQSEFEKRYSNDNDHNKINASSYSEFINGNIWDERMLKVR